MIVRSKSITVEDLEDDQQQLIEKSDIKTLAKYCTDLASKQEEIKTAEEALKLLVEEADKISSEIIPNLLAEQGLASLKLADGSIVEVKKMYRCSVRKDFQADAFQWLRNNELGDIIKNVVSVGFGMGEDNKAEQMLSLAEQQGYQPEQKTTVHAGTLAALLRERIEAGLDMPSDFFSTFVKDETKISRK